MQHKTLASVSRTACNALGAEASTGSALDRMRVAEVSIGSALVILKCERIQEQGTPPTLAAMKHASPIVRDGGTGTLKRNKEGTSQIRSCRPAKGHLSRNLYYRSPPMAEVAPRNLIHLPLAQRTRACFGHQHTVQQQHIHITS